MKIKKFNNLKQKVSYVSEGYSGKKVKRDLYCVEKSYDGEKYIFKYREEIIFNKENGVNTINKKAICIGYNPASANEEVDVTNKRLINLLWDEFDGYELINLYPQVSSNVLSCILDLSENKDFGDIIVDYLENDLNTIILFFGRTVCLPKKIYESILTRIENGHPLKMTTHNDKFIHPAANGKIVIKDVTKANIIETYHIC